MTDSVAGLSQAIQQFADERDWGQFHSPKNLAAALIVEAGELLEHFQWLGPAAVSRLMSGGDEARVRLIAEEFADVMMYGLQLARTLDIDITGEILRKIDIVD